MGNSAGAGSVTVYSRTSSGNTAPLRTLSVGMGVLWLALDLTHDELLVLRGFIDFINGVVIDSLNVYDRTANGNTASLRTLRVGPILSLPPLGLALDLTHDEVFVAYKESVAVYSRTASGDTPPLRVLTVDHPGSLAIDHEQ